MSYPSATYNDGGNLVWGTQSVAIASSTPGIPITISSVTAASPAVVTTATPHGLTTGQSVVITGATTTPTVDGTQVATVLTSTTFSVPVAVTVADSTGGTVTPFLTNTFILEEGEIKFSSKRIATQDTVGRDNNQAFIPQPWTGTATLQIPNPTTPHPGLFAIVPIIPIGQSTPVNFVISEGGENFKQSDASKFSVTLTQKLN